MIPARLFLGMNGMEVLNNMWKGNVVFADAISDDVLNDPRNHAAILDWAERHQASHIECESNTLWGQRSLFEVNHSLKICDCVVAPEEFVKGLWLNVAGFKAYMGSAQMQIGRAHV